MTDRILDLSEMTPRILDASGVERLFEDLAFETTVLSVVLRRPDEAPAEAPPEAPAPNLREAKRALLDGSASGAQFRYVHQGMEWWDTLMRTTAGFRVVRVKQPPRKAE